MTAFDPAAWLDRFTAVGGWYLRTPDGETHAGWRVDDFDQALAARAVWREIEDRPERRGAVRDLIS